MDMALKARAKGIGILDLQERLGILNVKVGRVCRQEFLKFGHSGDLHGNDSALLQFEKSVGPLVKRIGMHPWIRTKTSNPKSPAPKVPNRAGFSNINTLNGLPRAPLPGPHKGSVDDANAPGIDPQAAPGHDHGGHPSFERYHTEEHPKERGSLRGGAAGKEGGQIIPTNGDDNGHRRGQTNSHDDEKGRRDAELIAVFHGGKSTR